MKYGIYIYIYCMDFCMVINDMGENIRNIKLNQRFSTLPTKGHLATSGVIFGHQSWWRGTTGS